MAEKRKLTVLPNLPPESEDAMPARPPWHWVAFGVVMIFLAWLPLAWLAEKVALLAASRWIGPLGGAPEELAEHISRAPDDVRMRLTLVVFGTRIFAMLFAAAGGGFVMGRFGTATASSPGVRPREGAMAGLAVGIAALALASATSDVSAGSLLALPLLGGAGALGAQWGRRRRGPRGAAREKTR